MGSGSSEQQKNQSNESEWTKYQAELALDKPSQIQPYSAREMAYLQQLFTTLDKKNMKSLQIKDFQEIGCLREHALFSRMRELFQEQMKKTKAKRINFELFVYLLSVFHVGTELQTKYKYLFRLYDCDRNSKIDGNDLNKVFRMIYNQPFMQEEDYSKLVTQTLIKYGNKGEIKLQNVMELVSEDQLKEFLSFRFNNKFS